MSSDAERARAEQQVAEQRERESVQEEDIEEISEWELEGRRRKGLLPPLTGAQREKIAQRKEEEKTAAVPQRTRNWYVPDTLIPSRISNVIDSYDGRRDVCIEREGVVIPQKREPQIIMRHFRKAGERPAKGFVWRTTAPHEPEVREECQTFEERTVQCVKENSGADKCALIYAVYKCAVGDKPLTPPLAGGLIYKYDSGRMGFQELAKVGEDCTQKLVREGKLAKTNDKFMGDPVYTLRK